MKPSEYVAAVADKLKADGWIQGAMHNDQGTCLMGAMAWVTLDNLHTGSWLVGSGTPQRVQARMMDRMGCGIPAWNDAPGRTLNEVLDLLHDCQIELKEEGL